MMIHSLPVVAGRSGLRLVALRVLVAVVALWLMPGAAAAMFISSMPSVDAEVIVADGSTVYTVTMSATHPFGYNLIENVRVLFNYSQSGLDPSRGRGYMAWGKTDANITKYGGTWVLGDATGGGRWGYMVGSWGGAQDQYITPLSCSVTFTGNATGGDGTVTARWTFLARPAWARNPLINSADGWAEAQDASTGWRQNAVELVVVESPCQTAADAPRAIRTANPSHNTLEISIHPDDPDDRLYLIRVQPSSHVRAYVQEDGSLGPVPVWRTKQQWQQTTVRGLWSETEYTFTARAVSLDGSLCPSAYGAPATAATQRQQIVLDVTAATRPMSRGVLGQATNVTVHPSTSAGNAQHWEMVRRSSVRGPAGGLDADTYNWKDMSGTWVGHTGTPGPYELTTLSWLRLARDYEAQPVITVNSRGIGPLQSSGGCRFYYSDTSDETIAQLAAHWVRYVNHILRTYRQGDVLPPEDQAILDSIDWQGRPKLLAPGEPPTPRVEYWEIGNEPELGYPWCTPGSPVAQTPEHYARVYKKVTQAMLAVDPAIKVGPCITTAAPGRAHPWLDAVLADPQNPVHFIAYHPYGPLMHVASSYGDTPASAERGLRDVRTFLERDFNGARERVIASGRNPATIEFLATEWNVSYWRWLGTTQIRRQAHALGVAETLLVLAEQGIPHAHFWFGPSWGDGTEIPGYKAFKKAHELWGDRFISSFSDGHNLRGYVTWRSTTAEYIVWVLNFSEDRDKTAEISLPGLGSVAKVTMHRLANVNGPTSLFDRNDPPASSPVNIDWQVTDITAGVDPRNFTMTFPKATITVLVFKAHPRDLPLNTQVTLPEMIVTASYPSEGYFYVQAADRSYGIRVQSNMSGLSPGDRVSVSGVVSERRIGNIPSERQITSPVVTKLGTGPEAVPLVMNCRSVGGGPFAGMPGVRGGRGLNNIGLLVTITGQVKYILGSYINIDDGTGVEDFQGRTGILVRLPSGVSGIGLGDIVKITGVIEGSIPLGWNENRRFIRARRSSDVQVLVKSGGW
ncbi:MAG: hypothetical protein ACUVSM_08375 [Armatimonadota bacterium]